MKKFFKNIGRILQGIQKGFFSLFFWIILISVLFYLFYNPVPKVKGGEALVLMPSGAIVDEYSQAPYEREWNAYLGEPPSETLLADMKETLSLAARDSRLPSVLLDLSMFWGGGAAVLEEFRQALLDYKKSGKPLYLYAPYLEQSGLYLASIADEVVIDPMGEVFIRGYGNYRAYYKKGLDLWGLNAHVYRAGDNKSFVEPFLRDSMSRREKEAARTYLDDLWGSWLSETAYGLGNETEELQEYADRYGTLLSRELSAGHLAMSRGLADKLMEYEDFSRLMTERVGYDEKRGAFKQIHWQDYLAREGHSGSILPGPYVAMLTLSGEIFWGQGDWSRMGSSQVEEILDAILYDQSARALVVRIDSPGGSAMGAEAIRRKLARFHDYGVPVIISVGDMAASGGYWIACEGDEIWIDKTSLTGSIGVFSYFITLEEIMEEKGGIVVDGFGTTALSDAYRMDRNTSRETDLMLQAGVDQVYAQFLDLVSQRRSIPTDDLEKLAGGLVWTGRQAVENGLADSLGGLEDALDAAALAAGLGGDYRIQEYDDNALIPAGGMGSFLPGIVSSIKRPGILSDFSMGLLSILNEGQSDAYMEFPGDNPFGDPRRINAWGDL